MRHNILTPSKRSVILQHKDFIIELRHFKKISKFLKSLDIHDLDSKTLYDLLYESDLKNCNNSKFISFSVGYRSCSRTCKCYVENLSSKISDIKSKYDSDKKEKINQKRKITVNLKHGVDSVFQLAAVKNKSKLTKKHKYGDENYRNSEKIVETNLTKYGVDNPMKSENLRSVYYEEFYKRDFLSISKKVKSTKKQKYGDENYRNSEKIIETNLTRYGVDNPPKSLKVKEKISKNLRASLYDRFTLKYGNVLTPLFSKEDYINGIDDVWQCYLCGNAVEGSIINGIIPRCLTCYPYRISKFEIEVRNFLENDLKVPSIVANDRTLISPKELDILIHEKKLAIECNGLYRHCENSGIKPKNYHLEKTKQVNKIGYSLMHILDVDWYNSQNIVKSMLRHKLGLSKKLHARKGKIRALSFSESSKFFEDNHLQGNVSSKLSFGLVVDDQLVSAMSFSKSRYSKQADWELLRFCNVVDHTVVGAASKLISHFRKHHTGTVISYCDQSYGGSGFYSQIGFRKIKETPPGYYYVKDGKLFSRIKFQKHKLKNVLENFDPNKTEWENMQSNGYDRIWDCGHTVYML
jgi:hypothetical protein